MSWVRCADYKRDTLQSIPDHIWSGMPDVSGKRVFIKPNLVCPPTRWDKASTTSVNVVRLVIERLQDAGASSIVVGDCGFQDQWDATLEISGYGKLSKQYGVELIGLQCGPNFHRFTLHRLNKGEYMSLYGAKISDFVLGCDTVFNLPKLKVHSMALVTGAIKNMMGTMAQKGSMHPKANIKILHKRLRDLYYIMSPLVGFVLMDGVYGSEYTEQYGVPVHSGLLISGTDMWEVDCLAASAMDICHEDVPYLTYIGRDKAIDSPDLIDESAVISYERPLAWRKTK